MSDPVLQGFGLGLRTEHYADFERRGTTVDWLEILSENYMVPGGRPLHHLDRIRADHAMVMHGVSMSIGGTDPLDLAYLRELKALAARVQPAWLSDHLCWTGVNGRNLHDLLPLPMSEAALRHVAARLDEVQHRLGRRIAIENLSSYVRFAADEMREYEFVAELLKRSDAMLLLDVNNVYVSSVNHGFDARAYIDAMPADRVVQIHLAGHSRVDPSSGEYNERSPEGMARRLRNGRALGPPIEDGFLIDTHDAPVCDAVWDLYRYTITRLGPRPTMIERDDHIPALDELLAELHIARRITAEVAADGTVAGTGAGPAADPPADSAAGVKAGAEAAA
jgi:uncharacterized protein (UPF0276 family)